MDINALKRIITDQKEELPVFLSQEKIIKRDIDANNLKKYLAHPNVLVISGPRRSGKSTLSTSIFDKGKFAYINFDDDELAGFKSGHFNLLLQAFYEIYNESIDCFVFDEIQNINGWELFISKLRKTKKIIITGSNAKLLSGELATHLTGRYIKFKLYPFSFREYLRYNGLEIEKKNLYSTKKISQIKKHLKKYIKIGGFPETYKFGEKIVKNIYSDIINKDILFRHQIKHKNTFKELSNYLISNFGQELSYRKLVNIFSIKNVHTIKNYIEYLTESYLINILHRFSFKLKQQYMAPKKSYAIDNGIINSIAFQFSENSGRLMENLVYTEFLRKISYEEYAENIFYWRDHANKEVDFVLRKGKKIIELIQVCQSLENIQTKEREIKSLTKASKELNCGNLTIITDNYENEEKIKGKKIKYIPLYKFLLE